MSEHSKHKHMEDLAADVDLLTTAQAAFEKIKGDVGEDRGEVITAFNTVLEDIEELIMSAPKIVCHISLSLLCINDTLYYFRKHLSLVLNLNTSHQLVLEGGTLFL